MGDEELREMLSIVEEQEGDWWYKMTQEEQAEIEEGLKQADEGKLKDHSTVMQIFDKWQ